MKMSNYDKMRGLERGAGYITEDPTVEQKFENEYKDAKRPKRVEETDEERAIRLARWKEQFQRDQQAQALKEQLKYGFPGINGIVRRDAAPVIEAVDPEPVSDINPIPNMGIGNPYDRFKK
jgi:hypothetical protein